MNKLNDASIISRAKGVIHKEIENKVYILDYQTAGLRTLNETAGIIWKKLEKPLTFKELLAHLVETFAVDNSTAKKDLKQFILLYEKLGFIKTKNGKQKAKRFKNKAVQT